MKRDLKALWGNTHATLSVCQRCTHSLITFYPSAHPLSAPLLRRTVELSDPSKCSLRLRLCVLHVLSLLAFVIPLLLSQPPPLIKIVSLSFLRVSFLYLWERAEEECARREETVRKERVGEDETRCTQSGVAERSGNVASEGRMKALVTSHRANVHTWTHTHSHTTWETHSPTEPSFEKKKVQLEWKRRKKNKQEEATVLDVSFWPIFVLTHKSNRRWGAGRSIKTGHCGKYLKLCWWHELQLGSANKRNKRVYTVLRQVRFDACSNKRTILRPSSLTVASSSAVRPLAPVWPPPACLCKRRWGLAGTGRVPQCAVRPCLHLSELRVGESWTSPRRLELNLRKPLSLRRRFFQIGRMNVLQTHMCTYVHVQYCYPQQEDLLLYFV